MIVLGIETSCDETSAAVVKLNSINRCEILSNVVHSQISEHTDYGGVVPEIAARSHIQYIDEVILRAMNEADCDFNNLDSIAVTAGPGLKGGLLVGVTIAKAISSVTKKPLLGINHLEGHALTIRMVQKIEFPYLLLLVTGGHTQILIVRNVGEYTRLGTTIDDALGEAYDKVAKSLNLGYPGGPIVESMANNKTDYNFTFPRPLINSQELNFSFSGLKTAVRREIEKSIPISKETASNICAEFQDSIIDVLKDKLERSIYCFRDEFKDIDLNVVIAGGVAANKKIFSSIKELSDQKEFNVFVAPKELCSDNAAMIAWAGIERSNAGVLETNDVSVRTRWPLDLEGQKVRGAGVKA